MPTVAQLIKELQKVADQNADVVLMVGENETAVFVVDEEAGDPGELYIRSE